MKFEYETYRKMYTDMFGEMLDELGVDLTSSSYQMKRKMKMRQNGFERNEMKKKQSKEMKENKQKPKGNNEEPEIVNEIMKKENMNH